MTNETIAKRILEVVDAYENGRASASSVAESIELHEPALESVPRQIRDKLHKLSVEILEQDISPIEEEITGIKPSNKALVEMKKLLGQLC